MVPSQTDLNQAEGGRESPSGGPRSSSLVVARDCADLRPVFGLAWEHNTLATGSAGMVSVFSVGDYEAVRWGLIDSVDGDRRGNGVVRCCGAGMFICAVPGRGR